MRANNALALIFANSNDKLFPELTAQRSMASIPYGSRYRIIDFHLSNFVNAGVDKVAIIPRANYRSLMDHIGSGKAWDLDRKKGGLSFMPPFIAGNDAGVYKGHIDAIKNMFSYIEKSRQEYVIICDADTVLNIDIEDMLESHVKSGADVTAAYKKFAILNSVSEHPRFTVSENQEITEVVVTECTEKPDNYGLGIYIFAKDKLLEYVRDASERGYIGISRGILQRRQNLKINGYNVDNFVALIDSLQSFTEANLALLNKDVRDDLFNRERPIYTKTRDDMPTRYGLDSDVKNSIIGEGCIIEGKVENCVLFRGVKVKKGAVLKSCIIMQDSIIGENCNLQYVTADKDVTVLDGHNICGTDTHYFIIKKNETV